MYLLLESVIMWCILKSKWPGLRNNTEVEKVCRGDILGAFLAFHQRPWLFEEVQEAVNQAWRLFAVGPDLWNTLPRELHGPPAALLLTVNKLHPVQELIFPHGKVVIVETVTWKTMACNTLLWSCCCWRQWCYAAFGYIFKLYQYRALCCVLQAM